LQQVLPDVMSTGLEKGHRTMINKLSIRLAAVLCVAGAWTVSASAAEWGTLKGKLVYEGKVENKPLAITKDPQFCSQHKPVDETVVLGEDGALQNVFIYLSPARGAKVEIHPDFKPADLKPVVIDNKGCRFEPRAQVMWTVQPLEIHNSDQGIGHNTNASEMRANAGFNEIIPNDKPAVKKFTKSEPAPTRIACSIHPWMNAYLLIRDNPYTAVSNKDGVFEIKNVPAGKQTFTIWHEAKGYVRDLAVGDEETDRKGEVDLVIPAGKTLDLGTIKITPDLLGR
jgi:hypothetical protein